MIRVYVASPYNNPQGKVMDTRAKDIAYDVNSLMEQCGKDFVFFSPICHGHFISEVAGHVHRGGADYWMPLCESMLKTWADVLVVIASKDDADNSEGIQAEIKIAKEKGIPVIQSYELNAIISKLYQYHYKQWRKVNIEEPYGKEWNDKSAEQPSRYQSFFDLLDHIKQRTLKNADKGGVYDYDDAFFQKKFLQERAEFLSAIEFGVEEDYMDKAADFIAYYVGWANKIIQEAENENKA